ncbi:glutaredoxin [Gurleya vavrai]
MIENNDLFEETFKALDSYDSIIAYSNTKSIPQKFIDVVEPNYTTVDLSNEKLKKAFFYFYNINELPCLLTAKKPIYDNKNFDEDLIAAKENLFLQTKEFVEGLVKKHKNFIFIKGTPTMPECGFTRQLVKLFSEKGLESGRDYGYFNIFESEKIRQAMKKINKWPTFPQIYLNEKFFGGLDVLIAMVEDGSFDKNIDDYYISEKDL